jgi:hypothetical protein
MGFIAHFCPKYDEPREVFLPRATIARKLS